MRSARIILALLGAAVISSRPSAAQEVRVPGAEAMSPREFTPAKLPQPTLTLADAVQLTIRHDPQISQATQTLRSASGRHQQATGLFDAMLQVGPGMGYSQQPIMPFLRDREIGTRETIRSIAAEFTTLNKQLRDLIARKVQYRPRCPGGLSFGVDPLILDRRAPEEIALLGVKQDLRVVVIGDLERAFSGINLANICISTPTPDVEPDVFLEFWRRIDYSGNLGLEGILTSVSQIPHEARLFEAQITEAVAARARLALERMGPIPLDQLTRNFLFDVSLFKPFRNGLMLAGDIRFESEEQNFKDKPLDPTFGALGVPPRFPSSAAVSLDVPLGKGRGRVSAAAPERAAELTLGAQREETRHTISEQIFQTVLSYLNVVAAQERLALLEASAARQQRLVALTGQQVEAGDLPGLELDRVRARAASVASAVHGARASLVAARIALVQAVGADLDGLGQAPVATDRFAAARPSLPTIEMLLRKTTTGRRDTRSLLRLRDASAILATASRADLRRRFDLSVVGGLSNAYESPFFRYLPDEVDPIYSDFAPKPVRQSPTRYYSARGFYRSFTGRWEPFLDASLTLQFPLANNAAKGRLVQAQATLSSSHVETANLDRVIRENVVNVSGALRLAAEAIAQWEHAVKNGEEALQAALQRFELGEMTLIDTLLTEEDVTRDTLELVGQRQIYLSTLARLKFETGELVDFENEGTAAEMIRFEPSELVVR